ncbi:probable G-protein coupled receptor 139 [Rhincodon typus]|uniref:probable G-protein coupled receptor 139 n=1 Tax=Rhincodon typus TaxID=259920 RepID=UPI0020307A7D|nr:probable G-protein coupled receptor 139 [Rhincodon typus]
MDTVPNIKKVYYMILAVIGVPVNLVAIAILSRAKCGLSGCTTRYLVDMAVADLLVIVTDIILWRISYYYFPGSFLDITPVCSVIYVLTCAARDCSVWFTVTFSFDRFVAICFQKLRIKYCTEKNATAVLAITCILLCFKNVPFYFTFEPGEIIDNVPWFCYSKSSYYTEPGWVGFDWMDTILTPVLPFALISLFNCLTIRYIVIASRVRKKLRHQTKGGNRIDEKMANRRKSIILLLSISGSFILLWLTYVLHFIYYNITTTNPERYEDSLYIFQQAGVMLLSLNCCTNTFIYALTQSQFREQFMRAIKYPVNTVFQITNKQNNRN